MVFRKECIKIDGKSVLRLSQCLVLLPLLCTGCEKYYLSVKHERIDCSGLASTFVRSPDPRQKHPPKGQELILEWRLPRQTLEKELVLALSIIYNNHTEEKVYFPVTHCRGIVTYSVLNEDYERTKGFLTYKGEILTKEGRVLKEWKQQLWTDLITID